MHMVFTVYKNRTVRIGMLLAWVRGLNTAKHQNICAFAGVVCFVGLVVKIPGVKLLRHEQHVAAPEA